jgi:hypothetical protein
VNTINPVSTRSGAVQLHALRHSWASLSLSRGANLLYLTMAGGWTNATMLLKTCAKWVPEDQGVPVSTAATQLATTDVSPRNAERVEVTI